MKHDNYCPFFSLIGKGPMRCNSEIKCALKAENDNTVYCTLLDISENLQTLVKLLEKSDT